VVILGEPPNPRELPAVERKQFPTMTAKSDTQEMFEQRTQWVGERIKKSGRIIYPTANFTQPRLRAGKKREPTNEQAKEVMKEFHGFPVLGVPTALGNLQSPGKSAENVSHASALVCNEVPIPYQTHQHMQSGCTPSTEQNGKKKERGELLVRRDHQ
jgi:hypothetical protein